MGWFIEPALTIDHCTAAGWTIGTNGASHTAYMITISIGLQNMTAKQRINVSQAKFLGTFSPHLKAHDPPDRSNQWCAEY